MERYQFALYQMKDIPENRQLRFRPYETFKEYRRQVRCENYQQRYLGQMRMGDTPGSIRERLEKHPPRCLRGRAVSVSDVLVLNQGGEICFLASNFPHFHRYDSLKSALYIHAVSKNINTFPKNQGRIRAAIAVKILDFTVMYR